MPGKQMAIDSDLAAGLITEQEAIRKRNELQLEADFYGNMDGASKFISGDVMVGIFITLINSLGGILIGILSFKMNASESAKTFILLTVGDGLVSQIPSILNATAAGIIVTRSMVDDTIGKSLEKEVKRSSRPLWILSVTLFLFAFFPGFPTLVFLILSGLFGFLAYSLTRKEIVAEKVAEKEEAKKEEEKPQVIERLSPIEPIILEIGYALIPLVDKAQGGDLFDRIRNVRNQIAFDYGMIVPTIVVRDSLKLDQDQYSIKIHGVEVASWRLYPDKLLAINPGTITEEIEGEKVEEPSYYLPAVWIDPSLKDTAEGYGYTVIDSSTVIVTHLTETLIKNVDSLLGREEVRGII
jgi:flagellar biosynthesis protein FlhA